MRGSYRWDKHLRELGMLWDSNQDQEHLWQTLPALAEVLEHCSKVGKEIEQERADRLRAERESRESRNNGTAS